MRHDTERCVSDPVGVFDDHTQARIFADHYYRLKPGICVKNFDASIFDHHELSYHEDEKLEIIECDLNRLIPIVL